MVASVRTIDFSEHKGRKWEPGEHEGCQYVNLYHMHVKRPKKVGGKSKAGGSTVG